MTIPVHDPVGRINFDFSCDLYFRIKHSGGRKDRLLCRFAVNPAFVLKPIVELSKAELDPDKIMKNNKYDENFMIEIHFRDKCTLCRSTNDLLLLCKPCSETMKNSDLPYWSMIKIILDNHSYPGYSSGCMTHFGSTPSDFLRVLSKI
jgi:hypothetical protein